MDFEDVEELLPMVRKHYKGRVIWIPTPEQLDLIEDYAYHGIYQPAKVALLLGIPEIELAISGLIYPEILNRMRLGGVKAELDLNKATMNMAKGIGDPACLAAAKFALKARFNVIEEKSKLDLENRKFKFEKRKHKDVMELANANLTLKYTPEEIADILSKQEG
jgi:hypothetical protein